MGVEQLDLNVAVAGKAGVAIRGRHAARWLGALTVAVALLAPSTALAADEDPPGRVGRVAAVQGALHHAAGDDVASAWADAGLNYPVAQGDNLWQETGGQAEVDYGGGQFRLGGGTSLQVSRLDDRQLALFVASGHVVVRVRVLDADDVVRIDTPAAQVALTRPGLYRLDVADAPPRTVIAVREGAADIANDGRTLALYPGQRATLSGVAGDTADVGRSGSLDGLDTWSAARDRVYEAPRENAYVSRQMIGQADLDAYGAWQLFPDYGAVWFPASVDPEWAPYRYGHWTWVSGWGYSWVDQAPWGYAPFHYGRWAHIGGRWGWCPGTYVQRPAWAPALVAWYRTRPDRSRHAPPAYGWVPLGWREPFVPAVAPCGDRCWMRFNRPYAVTLDGGRRVIDPGRHVNWAVPGAATAIPATALVDGAPVLSNRVPLPRDSSVPPVAAAPPLARPDPTGAPVRVDRPRAPRPASTLAVISVPVPRARAPSPAGASRSGSAAQVATTPGAALARSPMRIDDGRRAGPSLPATRSVAPPPVAAERAFRVFPVPVPARQPPTIAPPPVAPLAPITVMPPAIPTVPRPVTPVIAHAPAPVAPVLPVAPIQAPAPTPIPGVPTGAGASRAPGPSPGAPPNPGAGRL